MTASELFALSQGTKCAGDLQCHWCGAPCTRELLHDDAPPIPFYRSTSMAKVPSSPYCCVGCNLWRRPSRTVVFLTAKSQRVVLRDRQAAKNHSWLVTEKDALALERNKNPDEVYAFLLAPLTTFALLLRAQEKKTDVQIQLGTVNDGHNVLAETPLHFTLDNIPHFYTPYELEYALRTGEINGRAAGVRVLVEMFGTVTLPPEDVKKGGRPGGPAEDGKLLKKPVNGGKR